MKFLKIILVNGFLFFYGSWIVIDTLRPGGIFMDIYHNYKKISHINSHQKKVNDKLEYYQWLIKGYKNKDEEIIAFLFFFKFNFIVQGYEVIKKEE